MPKKQSTKPKKKAQPSSDSWAEFRQRGVGIISYSEAEKAGRIPEYLADELAGKCVSCETVARETYRQVNVLVGDFLSALPAYPDGFSVTTGAWREAERVIDHAVRDNDLQRTIAACKDYIKRAIAFLERWQKRVAN